MKLKIAILLTLIAVGLHAYLTLHYYDLNYGSTSGESVCNVSEKFNCDSVSMSQYSTLLGAPLALWGAATNIILLVLLVGWMIGWTDNISLLSRSAFVLSLLTVSASIVMGVVSLLFLNSYCLFCIGAYVVSFVTAPLLYQELDETPDLVKTIKNWFGARIYLGFIAAIPALVFFGHLSISRQPQTAAIQKQAGLFVNQWALASVNVFEQAPMLVLGDTSAKPKMVITEFADFRCHHCKNAAPSLKAFVKSRNDVQLQFFVFPLEKVPETDPENKCISCNLAKAVVCTGTDSQKGWGMHDKIFAAQEEIIGMSAEKVNGKMSEFAKELGLSETEFATCYKSAETHSRIKATAQMGEKAMVQSTPTIFVNGKKLANGQLLPVLDGVYKTLR